MDYNPKIMTDIFNKAVALHDGDEQAARDWMAKDNDDFNGHSPLSTCKPYEGAVRVNTYLTEKLKHKNTR